MRLVAHETVMKIDMEGRETHSYRITFKKNSSSRSRRRTLVI